MFKLDENPSTYSENTIDYPDAGGPVNFETNYKKYMRLCYISDVGKSEYSDVVTVPDTQLIINVYVPVYYKKIVDGLTSNSSVDHYISNWTYSRIYHYTAIHARWLCRIHGIG